MRGDELARLAGELHARLHYGRTDDIVRQGLHEYLMDFLQRISALGDEISGDSWFPPIDSQAYR